MGFKLFFFFICFSILGSNSFSQEEADSPWTGQGKISLESRSFKNDHLDSSKDQGFAVLTQIESRYEKVNFKGVFKAHSRADKNDEDRNAFNLEDLYMAYTLGPDENFTISLGTKVFNWSATEAFHPADIINSRNFDSDLESLEKKGELTLSFDFQWGEGGLTLFYFPKFETPDFPGPKSRLGTGLAVLHPYWVNKKGIASQNSWGPQGGIQVSQTLGNADISFHLINHLDRSRPLLQFSPHGLTPYFFRVTQLGGTYQHALGDFLLKLEGAYRDFDNSLQILTLNGLRTTSDHTQLAIGTEYLWAHEWGGESQFFLEAQSIFGTSKERRAELDVFQRDLLLGYRLAFNDTQSTELFISLITDLERTRERLLNFYFDRRLTDNWKYKFGFRLYDAPPKKGIPVGLETFHEDHYVFFNLSRYF